ncbi:TadE/TadG family type IV pilus assembly protein [Nocardioides sp. InS609-2]|uniref:TadE/TadG family type IV pilus assembly protein n=1 Tax=Nocardioides sp. InS609-2 TaxID=2760705 RepID=UPI0020BDB319|nr:TadE/TadG family type IV pilus assembly protein [Nocardioides sp. InS609-2]
MRFPRRDQRGAAVVDFVFVLILLLPLFLGILQLALVLHVRNTLASAAAEGARYAATLGATPEGGQQKAREQIDGALSERFAKDIKIEQVEVDGAPAFKVTIRAEVPPLGLGGPGVPLEVSGNAIIEQGPGDVP